MTGTGLRCYQPQKSFSQPEQTTKQNHIHRPVKRAIACMSSFNPHAFTPRILSESRVLSHTKERLCFLLCGLPSEHLQQCSFQLAAIHPTDGKNGTAAFESLFKILCDFLCFNVNTLCS